jgi:MFS family permease
MDISNFQNVCRNWYIFSLFLFPFLFPNQIPKPNHLPKIIGEASFTVIAPALLCNFFPSEQRNKVLAILGASAPVGAAFGYLLGGTLAELLNWRQAFLILGVPGILILLLLIPVKDPGPQEGEQTNQKVVSWFSAIKQLSTNKTFIFAILGSVSLTWAIGGM